MSIPKLCATYFTNKWCNMSTWSTVDEILEIGTDAKDLLWSYIEQEMPNPNLIMPFVSGDPFNFGVAILKDNTVSWSDVLQLANRACYCIKDVTDILSDKDIIIPIIEKYIVNTYQKQYSQMTTEEQNLVEINVLEVGSSFSVETMRVVKEHFPNANCISIDTLYCGKKFAVYELETYFLFLRVPKDCTSVDPLTCLLKGKHPTIQLYQIPFVEMDSIYNPLNSLCASIGVSPVFMKKSDYIPSENNLHNIFGTCKFALIKAAGMYDSTPNNLSLAEALAPHGTAIISGKDNHFVFQVESKQILSFNQWSFPPQPREQQLTSFIKDCNICSTATCKKLRIILKDQSIKMVDKCDEFIVKKEFIIDSYDYEKHISHSTSRVYGGSFCDLLLQTYPESEKTFSMLIFEDNLHDFGTPPKGFVCLKDNTSFLAFYFVVKACHLEQQQKGTLIIQIAPRKFDCDSITLLKSLVLESLSKSYVVEDEVTMYLCAPKGFVANKRLLETVSIVYYAHSFPDTTKFVLVSDLFCITDQIDYCGGNVVLKDFIFGSAHKMNVVGKSIFPFSPSRVTKVEWSEFVSKVNDVYTIYWRRILY